MRLTPKENEKLMLHLAGMVAKERKQRGLKLNYPESIAYISSELMELARDGKSVAELMCLGRKMLATEDVMDGVAEMIHEIQIEATFPDGTKLVTIHEPITPANTLIPGEVLVEKGNIELNVGKDTACIYVTNTADRPIQVGSHYHFFEANKCLKFNRSLAYGMRLDIPAGTAVRFEPGETRSVNLVQIGGKREGYGLNGLVNGSLDDAEKKENALRQAETDGFKNQCEEV